MFPHSHCSHTALFRIRFNIAASLIPASPDSRIIALVPLNDFPFVRHTGTVFIRSSGGFIPRAL
jgi:hypothetical protein